MKWCRGDGPPAYNPQHSSFQPSHQINHSNSKNFHYWFWFGWNKRDVAECCSTNNIHYWLIPFHLIPLNSIPQSLIFLWLPRRRQASPINSFVFLFVFSLCVFLELSWLKREGRDWIVEELAWKHITNNRVIWILWIQWSEQLFHSSNSIIPSLPKKEKKCFLLIHEMKWNELKDIITV